MQTVSEFGIYVGKTHSQILAEKQTIGKCPPSTKAVYWKASYAHIRATGRWLDGTKATSQEQASAQQDLLDM